MSDFRVENHGSILLLNPLTVAAEQWIGENLGDDVQYFGHAVAVEPRYMQHIIDGIEGDGLTGE